MIVITQPTRRRPKAVLPTGPVGGLADPRFSYTESVATDIRKTFRRVRADQKKAERL